VLASCWLNEGLRSPDITHLFTSTFDKTLGSCLASGRAEISILEPCASTPVPRSISERTSRSNRIDN
jgi:hypothetical protein